jgi:hypothetical protein
MKHHEANPTTIEELSFNNAYGNEDCKAIAGSRDEAIVTAGAGDVPGDEPLTTVCSYCNAWRIVSALDYSVLGREGRALLNLHERVHLDDLFTRRLTTRYDARRHDARRRISCTRLDIHSCCFSHTANFAVRILLRLFFRVVWYGSYRL